MKKEKEKIINNITAKGQAAHLANQFLLEEIEFVDKKFNYFNSGYLTLRAAKILAQTEVKNIIKILKHSDETTSKLCNYWKDVFNEIEKL